MDADHSALILIVEDDDGLRFGLSTYLAARGYRILEATCCDGAVACVARARPDLVLLDYRLPDGDALELMSKLRAVGVTAPAILLTGYGTIPLAVQAVKQGARDVLTKPVDMARLLRAVAEVVAAETAASTERPAGAPQAAASLTLWELERQALFDALVHEGGRVGRAAKRLGIPRSTIYLKIKAHDIDIGEIRDAETSRLLASRGRAGR